MQVIRASLTGHAGMWIDIHMADTWWLRYRGLLARPPLKTGEGLLLTRCKAVHTLGMAYAIDIVFLDRDWGIVGIVHHVSPGRWFVAAPRRSGARQVLELAAGEATRLGLQIGLVVHPDASPARGSNHSTTTVSAHSAPGRS